MTRQPREHDETAARHDNKKCSGMTAAAGRGRGATNIYVKRMVLGKTFSLAKTYSLIYWHFVEVLWLSDRRCSFARAVFRGIDSLLQAKCFCGGPVL